jgi:hypothetical protein
MVKPISAKNVTQLDKSLRSVIVAKPILIASSQTEVRELFRMAHNTGFEPKIVEL